MKQVFKIVIALLLLTTHSFRALPQSISSVKIKVLHQELELLEGHNDFQSDSIRIENLNQIALYQSNTNLDSALLTLAIAEKIALKLEDIDLTAVTHYNRGQVFEQHGDFAKSEQSYLIWHGLRKGQDIPKYRWALTGLREFYSRHLQFDKLESIDREWVNLIDSQLAANEEVMYGYEASMLTVVDNLFELGEVYKAESYFLHLLHNEASAVLWLQGSMFYFRVENEFLKMGDLETLLDWYTRWFIALNNYNDNSYDAVKTMSFVSEHLNLQPNIAVYLLEDLYQICETIKHPEAKSNFLRYWIPNLNKAVANGETNNVQSQLHNTVIQNAISFNTRAVLATESLTKQVHKTYLNSIKLATNSIWSTDGMEALFLSNFLRTSIESTTNKKLKKTLNKALVRLQTYMPKD